MLTDIQLINALKNLHSDEIKLVVKSIEHFNEAHHRDLALRLGYKSLYEFAELEIEMSHDMAYRRIRAAELVRFAPELADHLKNERVSMTSLAQVQVAFRRENARRIKAKEEQLTDQDKNEMLGKIIDGSSRATERVIAEQFPKLQPQREQVKPVSGDQTMVLALFKNSDFAEINAYKAEISHANPENTFAAVFMHAIRNARPKARKTKTSAAPREGRVKHPAHVEREVFARAEHRCQYTSSEGRRCSRTHHLQIDHITALALGGSNEIENLQALCGSHNREKARSEGLHRPSKRQHNANSKRRAEAPETATRAEIDAGVG